MVSDSAMPNVVHGVLILLLNSLVSSQFDNPRAAPPIRPAHPRDNSMSCDVATCVPPQCCHASSVPPQCRHTSSTPAAALSLLGVGSTRLQVEVAKNIDQPRCTILCMCGASQF